MIEGLQPYAEYKESGQQWLGRLPRNWKVLPLCRVASPKSDCGRPDLELLSVYLHRGVIRYSESGGQVHKPSLDLSNYQVVAPGDFVLNNQQAWRGSIGVSRHLGIISPAYLWRRILTPGGFTDILENYAQIVEEKNEKTGKKKRVQIFPRYHQLDVVRKLLADAAWFGSGQRYLIQHSAGSGKSNSIAWLAHQLIGLKKDGADVFDSIIVITDRRILDKQIRETIKGFAQIPGAAQEPLQGHRRVLRRTGVQGREGERG